MFAVNVCTSQDLAYWQSNDDNLLLRESTCDGSDYKPVTEETDWAT